MRKRRAHGPCRRSKRAAAAKPPARTAAAATPAPSGKASGGKGRKKPESARTPELIEREIAEAEQRLAALSTELSRPEVARAAARVNTLNDEYRTTDERLRSLYAEWERVAAEAANA